MDKNIAAFLDSSAYTVGVVFTANGPSHTAKGRKRYTYICNLPDVKVGDWVVVDAPDYDSDNQFTVPDLVSLPDTLLLIKGIPKMVRVVEVDKDVSITPNSEVQYGWVIGKLDMTAYKETLQRNSQITSLVAEAYKVSMRKSFADRILNDMDSESKNALLRLLSK